MALDPVISIAWLLQLLAVAALAVHSVVGRRWKAFAGFVIGAVIGNVPFFAGLGPGAYFPAFLLPIGSALVLVVICAARRRWAGFFAALVTTALIAALYELAGLFAPILCAVACRMLLELPGPAVPLRRNA